MLMNRFVGQSGELFFREISFVNDARKYISEVSVSNRELTKLIVIKNNELKRNIKRMGYAVSVKDAIKRIKLLQDSLSFL